MRIETRIVYAAPPAQVSAMTFDPAFQARKCQATGALSYSVDLTGSDSGTSVSGPGSGAGANGPGANGPGANGPGANGSGPATITTERQMPTDDFPDFVRSMVGPTVKVTEVDQWGAAEPDGGRTGSITVTISGAPLRLTGSLILRPTSEGAVAEVDADLKAAVPFLGARLESAAAPAILAAVRAEETTARVWLAER